MDLAKAFDTVNHKILLNKLEQYGLRGVANDLMKSYLTNRKQFISGNGFSSSLLGINIGVPQGSVLGPILFLIYINDLSNCSNFATTLYADDSVLTLSHKNINCLQNILNCELTKINSWLKSNQLSLNVDKTHFLLFTKRKHEIAVEINGSQIKQTVSNIWECILTISSAGLNMSSTSKQNCLLPLELSINCANIFP